MLTSELLKLPTYRAVKGFLTVWKFPHSRVSPQNRSLFLNLLLCFIFYILSYLFLNRLGCLSGFLVSSDSVQKLFVKVAQHSKDLLMGLWERKRSPCPILLPSWHRHLTNTFFQQHKRRLTCRHHWMVNTKIKLITSFVAEDGVDVYSEKKQYVELNVAKIISFS